MPNTPREKCLMCEKSFDQVEMRTIGDGLLRVYVAVRLSKRIFAEDYICKRCRLQFFHWLRVMEGDFDQFCSRDKTDNEFLRNNDDIIAMIVDNCEERIMESSVQTDPQTPIISIPVFRCSKSHQSCVVCGIEIISAKVLSSVQRTMIFLKRGVFVSPGSRCCSEHVVKKQLTVESFDKICISKADCWTLDSFGLQVLLKDIRSTLLQQNSFNFDDPTSLNEEAYKTIVGLTKDQFNDLIGTVYAMRNSHTRSIRTAVAIFLAKMHLSLSNRLLAILFHIDNKRNVSHIISQVRIALMKDFVPAHLGLHHIDRVTAINQHQTAIATILHTTKPQQLCVVADSTYLFIQKSSDNKFQRRSYSMHKHRHLVKPMILTTTDGYILCVMGPFLSDYKNNDASIFKHCVYNNEQDILNWLHDDDVLILDRGFRDTVRAMKQFGFQVAMPSFLNGRKQFSLEEANLNRCITKVRWIVESVNAQLKQWKYFSQTIPNSSLCFLSNYIDITCALINAYGSRCVQDIHSGTEMATQMLQKCQTTNPVPLRLLELLETKLQWKKYDAQLLIFPELPEQELRNLCYGTYQIKQAKSYIREHLTQSPLVDNDMEFIIELCAQHNDLVRARFESRHCNNKDHIATVQFKLYTESPISGWYCTCASGWRDVGCCAHVAALLWHLGVRRANINENTHPLSAGHLFASIDDSMQFSEVEESDEDQDDNDNDNHVYSVASNSTNGYYSTTDEEVVD
ncbi:unnamed protein product [Rotaria socialis]|uniref:SWIM-type domain-containing protein n=1 Tax=Rotaria socialis TaxID=392032 RepID=A0A821U7P6_9BILA|nr:unnamed protein product [Rotaria socialis]